MATALLDLIQNCIREEERRDAFEEFYRVCLAGLEAHALQEERLQRRIGPSEN
jgi:hypothetical protein